VVVLPNEGVEINDCIQGLTAEKWQNWMGNTANKIVNVELPKFKGEFTYEEKLKVALQSMGIKDLFNADKCDLSGIAEGIYVGKIKQNTFIEVNEEGTEAAAVTVEEMIYSSGKELIVIDFIANRPFIYAIKEKSTNAILFMGKVTNPKE
ncbi:MAG: serpin family protein, partial [Bacteroides sp.]|nr:serpin family protein [Bacteroides sp.]